jgi:hypothetical protein
LLSTPLETSTPQGFKPDTTSPTFSGLRPPAMMTGYFAAALRAVSQVKTFPVPPYFFSTKVSSR